MGGVYGLAIPLLNDTEFLVKTSIIVTHCLQILEEYTEIIK